MISGENYEDAFMRQGQESRVNQRMVLWRPKWQSWSNRVESDTRL